MKTYVIAITMMLALGMTAGATNQKHRHTPRTEQTDSAVTAKTAGPDAQGGQDAQSAPDAIEAYSDTTSAASDTTAAGQDDSADYSMTIGDRELTDKEFRILQTIAEGLGGFIGSGLALVLVILVILFLLLPVIIVIIVFYFINKNRREKYRLAQMALQNGQPIPNEVLNPAPAAPAPQDDYTTGIRQLCLGLGLMVLLGYTAGKVGLGIGALVFFIGLGKVIIAKTSGNKRNDDINQLKY